jgi:hypothetical protein
MRIGLISRSSAEVRRELSGAWLACEAVTDRSGPLLFGLWNMERESVQRCTEGLVQPIRRVAAQLSLPASAAAEPAGEVAVFDRRKGHAQTHSSKAIERDPRSPLIDTLESAVSPRTLGVSRSMGGLGDNCSFLLADGKVCSKQSILSRRRAAAAFRFPFKTLLSTSWNISPEYRRE